LAFSWIPLPTVIDRRRDRWNADFIEFFGLRRTVGMLSCSNRFFRNRSLCRPSANPGSLCRPSAKSSPAIHPRPPAGTTWRASETRRGDEFAAGRRGEEFAAGRLITSWTVITDSRFCVLLAEKIKRKLEFEIIRTNAKNTKRKTLHHCAGAKSSLKTVHIQNYISPALNERTKLMKSPPTK
jgi:hypothetical protein